MLADLLKSLAANKYSMFLSPTIEDRSVNLEFSDILKNCNSLTTNYELTETCMSLKYFTTCGAPNIVGVL